MAAGRDDVHACMQSFELIAGTSQTLLALKVLNASALASSAKSGRLVKLCCTVPQERAVKQQNQ